MATFTYQEKEWDDHMYVPEYAEMRFSDEELLHYIHDNTDHKVFDWDEEELEEFAEQHFGIDWYTSEITTFEIVVRFNEDCEFSWDDITLICLEAKTKLAKELILECAEHIIKKQ